MLVSTTVVSTRSLPTLDRLLVVLGHLNQAAMHLLSTTSGPSSLAILPITFASGTRSIPTRANSRHTMLARTCCFGFFKAPIDWRA